MIYSYVNKTDKWSHVRECGLEKDSEAFRLSGPSQYLKGWHTENKNKKNYIQDFYKHITEVF